MRSSRPYVQLDPAVIEQARQMDLLSYLRAYEPNNLVRVGGSVYCTREHDSLKISNGKWFWWSRGIGGVSALDYLIKVKDYGFVEAVEALTGGAVEWTPPQTPKKDEPKVLLLPPKNKDCNRVMQYLFGRGIDYQLIQECIADGTIYESADYHNAVFVGKDKSGTPKYAALRSTLGSPFKQDASGSDKRYSFRLLAKEPINTVHLFEAAVDLLSYATYLKCEGKDYRTQNLLSLSGVYQPKKELSESKVPIALSTYARLHYLLKDDLMKMEAIAKETRLLCRNHIDTAQQLLSYEGSLETEMSALLEKRKELYSKSRSAKDEDTKSQVKAELSDISKRLSILRKEVKLCEGIAARGDTLKEKLAAIRADEQEQQRKELTKNEHRRRSGRTNRPNELGGL